MESDTNFTRNLTKLSKMNDNIVINVFKSEIEEEARLEKKYQLTRTKEEMEKVQLI